MEVVFAVMVGLLFAAGLYGLLRRSMVRMIVGMILLSQAVNLLVFFSGGLKKGKPVFVPESGEALLGSADPIPQALVLTAIVIGFGLTAFMIVLFQRVFASEKSDDTGRLFHTDS